MCAPSDGQVHSRFMPNRNACICSPKGIHQDFYNDTVLELKLKTTQAYNKSGLDEYTYDIHAMEYYIYNNAKELCTTIHTNMDESHICTIEQKKPDTK